MPSDASEYEIGNVGPGAMVLQGENLSVGFTAAEVQQLVQAERAGLVQQYTSQLVELSGQLGATQEAVRTMLHIAGQDDVPAERWRNTLIAIATQFRAMRQALTRPADDDIETAKLQQQAISALDSGAFGDATRLLNDIRARERAASEQRRHRAAEARADWLAGLQSEAETCALLARAALARRDVPGAHRHLEDGLRVLAPADAPERWLYAMNAAGSLYDFGDHAGRNDALAAAIAIYHHALADAPRDRVPLQWALRRITSATRSRGWAGGRAGRRGWRRR